MFILFSTKTIIIENHLDDIGGLGYLAIHHIIGMHVVIINNTRYS